MSSPPSARLAFLLGLALVDVALAAALATALLGLLAGLLLPLASGPLLLLGVAVALAGWLLWRTHAPLRAALAAPAARLAAPELAVTPAEQAPLRVAGLLVLATLPLHLLSALGPGGAQRVVGGLQAVVVLAFAVGALRAARGAQLLPVSQARALAHFGDSPAEKLTETLLHVGTLAAASGILGWTAGQVLGRAELLPLAVEVGSILGLARSPLAEGRRRALLVGLVVNTIAGLVFGPAATALLAAAAVVLEGWRSRGRRAALAQGWRFALASALGRLLGTGIGLFLLGASGRTVGEVAGETLLAVLVLGSAPEDSSEPAPPPGS